MQIQDYDEGHWQAVTEVFNSCFAGRYRAMPLAMRRGVLREMLADRIENSINSAAWVAVKHNRIDGFVSAHANGKEEGIITTPVFALEDTKIGDALLRTAEAFLCENGVQSARVEGVDREYNIGIGSPEHLWLLDRGYNSYRYRDEHGLDLVMELDFEEFIVSSSIVELRQRNEEKGFVFELLQEKHIESFRRLAWGDWMLHGLEDPLSSEPTCYPYIICRKTETVVGFCGGLDVMSGRGGFSFITCEEDFRGRGIGAVMLSMALKWLKEKGAKVQVLFTSLDNPAQKLYQKAGFRYSFVSTQMVNRKLGTA